MIYFLATNYQWFDYNLFLATWGKPLAATVRVIPYERLFRMRRIPVGTYIFTDLEILPPRELEQAAVCWNALTASGQPVRLLNNPLRAMHRYELLRKLKAQGINDFDVYRLTEARQPNRYPVFIRGENDHAGPETELLHDREQLNAAVESLVAEGKSPEDRIVTEFIDNRDEQGRYRKFGAFIVGDRIIPRHVIYGPQWIVKGADRLVDSDIAAAELDYVRTNPHEAELREIFGLARVDYGRIDYDVIDGRIQVYEINTNPQTVKPGASRHAERSGVKPVFARNFIAALQAVDCPVPERTTIPVAFKLKTWRQRRRPIEDVVLSAVRRIGLARFEPAINLMIWRWRSSQD